MTNPLRFVVPLFAAVALPASASAGWDNVFQVACWDCRAKPSTSYYTAPPRVAEKHVEQRCYYEPVTVMKPVTERIEVPVQVKSYYWDPVQTYSYTSYYDPCTGCSQQIAVPRTSFVRKEQCNTVMKYVERIRMVPTEVQRKVCESRPVYTYYGPVTKSYDCATCELPAGGPRVDELRSAPPGVSSEERIPSPRLPTVGDGTVAPRSMPPARPVTVNAHTASRTTGAVRGEVVLNDQVTPRPGTKLVFVNAADTTKREYAQADGFGNFDLKLPAGDWYVYLGNGDGKATYHKKITIGEYDAREFKVVSR